MKKTIKYSTKVLSIFLAILMLVGVFPTSASAHAFDSGWEPFDTFPNLENEDNFQKYESSRSNAYQDKDTLETEFSTADNPEASDKTLPEDNSTEKSAEDNQQVTLGRSGSTGEILPWAANLHDMAQETRFKRSANATGINTTPILWGGGNIEFGGGTYYVGSGYIYRITHSEGEAFCAEFNGSAAGGSYTLAGEGSNSAIKQVIANYESSGKSNSDYIAAQAQIWSIILGMPVTSWGGSNPNMGIVNGSSDTTNTKYYIHNNKDVPHTQNIFTFENKETPPIVPEEPNEEEYKLRIIKRVEGTNELLAGATFEVRHTSHGVIGTFTTNSRGQFEVTVPWSGTYIVTEISAPTGYVMPDDPDAELYVDINNPEAERTFFNSPYTGIEVAKVDAHTGERLAGATIKITEISTGMSYTKETNSNGIAYFTNLRPNDYSVQEIVSPTGYKLNDTVYPISLESNKLATITIKDEKLGGLIVKKVDPDGKPIAGAVFELRTGGGTVITRETTDVNGIIFRGNLPTDTYVVEEIQAPKGFVLDPHNPQSIFIDTTTPNKEYTLTFVNQKKPAIEILKVDANDPSKVLFGATFRISEQGGSKTWDITTDRNGRALLENLEPDMTYVCEEIIPPSGYLNSGYRETIVLEVGKIHKITVANQKAPKLVISKVDADTGRALAGAVFRVTYDDASSYQDVTTGADGKATLEGLPKGWLTILEIKSPEGYLLNSEPIQKYMDGGSDLTVVVKNEKKPFIQIVKEDDLTGTRLAGAVFSITRKTDEGETLLGEYTTDENGEILLEVEPGRFLIQEKKAPEGFIIDEAIKEVTIAYGKTTVVKFTNTAEHPIYIQKIDPDGKPLRGAVFKVTTVQGVLVGEFKTGHSGYAIVPAEPGTYLVEEVRAPEGFILNIEPKIVELKPGKVAQVEFVNEKAPGFELLKLDADTRKPVMGAVFKITTTSGELIGELETDVNGRIHLEAIPNNTQAILVTEIRSADGYILDNTPHTVQLKPGETATLTVYNKAKPGLQIRKVDSVTLLPVSECVFSVQQLTAGGRKDLGAYTSGENGLIYIPELEEGYLEITEIKAKDGYLLDPTPKTVLIETGKLNTVEFRNQPYSNVVIKKIDENRKPLPGAIFRVYNERRIEIGTFEANDMGEVVIEKLTGEYIYIQEVKAPDGFVLDSTVHKVELEPGKVVTVQIKNIKKGSLRILKRDAETKKPLQGVTFLIYDAKNNILGEFLTDQSGIISLPSSLEPQKIKIKEIKTIDGYVLSDKPFMVEIKSGETTEVTVDNEPERGKIQIIKKAEEENDITKHKKGAVLSGAVFEVVNEQMEVVDTITTDSNGLATTKDLPLGRYAIREKTAPKHYLLLEGIFYAEIKVHNDLVKFEVLNKPVVPEVRIEKRGNVEALVGDSIRYDFSNIQNLSNVPLDNFYWRDILPTDAVRLEKIWTGTWNERLIYKVTYATNLKPNHKVLASGLHTNVNNEIDCSPTKLKLASNEYITEFRFEFGTVKSGFREVEAPFIFVKVLSTLPNEYRFTNKVDVGGQFGGEWVIDKDSWVTIIYRRPKGNLPKTGK